MIPARTKLSTLVALAQLCVVSAVYVCYRQERFITSQSPYKLGKFRAGPCLTQSLAHILSIRTHCLSFQQPERFQLSAQVTQTDGPLFWHVSLGYGRQTAMKHKLLTFV